MNIVKVFPYVLLLAPACAQERSSPPRIVTRNCSGCHRLDGKSQLTYIPRLAGLSAAYSERKLATFRAAASAPVDEVFRRVARIAGARTDDGLSRTAAVHMVGIANAISDKDIKAAAQWYASQAPARNNTGKSKGIEEGRSIYLKGLETQGLPACQTCHGAEAQGTDAAPRLAGQNAAYLLGQLDLFRRAEGIRNLKMSEIARNVGVDQGRAVAAYLASR